MGPLLLVVFAGHLGLSVVMGNGTVNGTNGNMTCHNMNGTQPANMSCPMNMTAGNNTNMPHNMTAGNNTNMPHNMTAGNNTNMPHNMTNGNNTNMPHNMTCPNGNRPNANMSCPMPHNMNNTQNTTRPNKGSTQPSIAVEFKLQQQFTQALNNPASPEFIALASNVTSQVNPVYQKRFGDNFNGSEVRGFSEGSVVVDLVLRFNNASSLPNTSDVVNTLSAAVAGGNLSLPINASSIKATVVTAQPATTAAAPTTAKAATTAANNANTQAAASDSTLGLTFKLIRTFVAALKNKSSPEYKSLESEVVTTIGSAVSNVTTGFRKAAVNSFANGSVIVDMTLTFANSSSVPAVANLTSDLKSQLANSSLGVDLTSISVSSTSTSATTANASANATATPAATAEPSTDAPSASEGTLDLQFKVDENFTSDLSNSSSNGYKTFVLKVIKVVNPICTRLFPGDFLRSIVDKLSAGSVKVDMTLVFKDKNSVPSVANATSLLSTALANSTLKVINGSIVVQSTTTSGCHPQPSPLSLLASLLAMMAAAQMLLRF